MYIFFGHILCLGKCLPPKTLKILQKLQNSLANNMVNFPHSSSRWLPTKTQQIPKRFSKYSIQSTCRIQKSVAQINLFFFFYFLFFFFLIGTTHTLLSVMKEHILHGYYHTYIENGILKYLISSTYCVFFFFFLTIKNTGT